MVDRVAKTIFRYNMLPQGRRVIAAVSGGADSVGLLHALVELAPKLGVRVEVAHLNHGLRGEESDGDEEFVREVAAGLGLPVHVARADVAGMGGNLEQSARRARLELFQTLLGGDGGSRVATGHTRNDQAETVMLRMLRGSGLAGLAGIHPVTETQLIRPLIETSRDEVVAYLRAKGIGWREDSSNRNTEFARNRIRHEVLPRLKADWNPQLGESLAQLADLAFEEEQWWRGGESPLSKVGRGFDGAVELDVRELAKLPRAVSRRAIRRAIARAKGNLRGVEFEHVERVIELAAQEDGDGRLQVPGLDVRRSYDYIRVAKPVVSPVVLAAVAVQIPGEYRAPDGKSFIRLEIVDSRRLEMVGGKEPCANLKAEVLGLSRVPEDVWLRGWRPGDRYRPAGDTRERKLKDMFAAARVPSWQRRYWPMVVSRETIVWSREFGAAAEFAAKFAAEGQSGPLLRISEVKS